MRPARASHPYAMLTAGLLLLVAFFFYPLAFAIYRSFYRWDLLTRPEWAGLAHYRDLWESGDLLHTLGVTVTFSAVVVLGATTLGLGLALLVSRPGRLARLARSAVFSAYVVSWVSVALLWSLLLDPDSGLVNGFLGALGVAPHDWLGDPDVALYAIAGVALWKLAGYAMVLFIAGLADVPSSVLEAASLDGAGPVDRFVHIVWPLLRPTTAFVTTTSLIASFQVFDIVQVLTQGGPVRSTTVFVYSIYEQIFVNLRVGRASAEVVIFFCLLMGLTALQLRVWRGRAPA